ncbi:MAG: hypothetical protein HQ580_03935 [Planctomycetes bacterium]|nr:hypothetical protein [Planctomycetota bacterium]
MSNGGAISTSCDPVAREGIKKIESIIAEREDKLVEMEDKFAEVEAKLVDIYGRLMM